MIEVVILIFGSDYDTEFLFLILPLLAKFKNL